MISKDITIVDIDPIQYEHLLSAFATRPHRDVGPRLIIFYRDNRVIHAVHSEKGPVTLARFAGPSHLAAIARENAVASVVCLEEGFLKRFTTSVQSQIRFDQTGWEQFAVLRSAFEKELGAGLHIHPNPFATFPAVPDFIVKTLKKLLPRRTMIVIAAFDGKSVWTSAIAEFNNFEMTLLTTTDGLGPITIDENMSTAAKANAVTSAVRKTWGTPTSGFYMDRIAFEQIAASGKPLKTFLRLHKRNWITITPLPGRLKVALALAQFLPF